jgi:type I restriction enzyme S subunit
MSVKASERIIPGSYALSVGMPALPAPPGWRWTKLSDVARLESGHTPSRARADYWNGDIGWVGIVDARDHHGQVIDATAQTITAAGLANSAARLLPRGTVCLVRTAASIGYVTVLGREMVTSQDLVDWICGEHLDPAFLMHLFIAEKESIKSFGKGSAHKTVYFPEVQAFHVCLPPVGEQRRIVAKLDHLLARSRRAREALDRIPQRLEALRRSVLAAAFRGDLTAGWREEHPEAESAEKLLARIRIERRQRWEEAEFAKMKARSKAPGDDRWKVRYVEPEPVDESGLPELPERWCWASLDELTFLVGGVTKGQRRRGDEVLRVVPYLRVANVQRGHLDLTEVKEIEATEDEIRELHLLPGDILLNEGGDRDKLGRGWVWSGELPECIHQNHVFRARPVSADLQPTYVSHFANTFGQAFFTDAGKQTTNLASVSMSRVKRLPVALAPAAEQQEIVRQVDAFLRRAERQGEVLAHAAERLGSLNRAVLAKAFCGGLVPPVPNDEPAETAPGLNALASGPDDGVPRRARGQGRRTKVQR